MMYYGMMGGYGTGFMFISWITSLLVLGLLGLGLAALWKYISKK